ncbi:MAG: glycosyltransferase family 2 protein [Planctomycetes bacterium]|nr:glycosyltransferase family 2 protein [Planctomycetota bacterium]
MKLSSCDYRSQVSSDSDYLCDHPSVFVADGIVTAAICYNCPLAGPRRPELEQIRQTQFRRRQLLQLKSVAVVIPCHNYGIFLSQAIESVLAQSSPASEIIVIVDRSSDNSQKIAELYHDKGVRTLVVDYGNVHSVRRRGFEETTADVLCFLDADDWISPDYLEQGLQRFDSLDVGIVYSDLYHFGSSTGQQVFTDKFSRLALNRDNFIHAGSLVRRDALEITKAFDQDLDPATASCTADWWLWRCVANGGWKACKQQGQYNYRRHAESALATKARHIEYFQSAWLEHEQITLFIPLSGRTHLWPRLAKFLELQKWPHNQTRLILFDTAQNSKFSQTVRQWLAESDYTDTRYIQRTVADPELADRPRAEHATDVRKAMARIYNALTSEVATQFVWIIEDDIIPPLNVARSLLESFDERTGSVAAPYRSRFHQGYVVWKNETETLMDLGKGVTEEGGNGFGCTIIRTELIQRTIFSHAYRLPDFDHAFYSFLHSEGFKAKVNWDMECQHFECDGTLPYASKRVNGNRRIPQEVKR